MDRAALEKVYGAFQDFHTYNLVCTFSAFQEFRMVLSWRNKVAGVVAVAALAVALLSAACTAPELIPAPTTASELAVPTAPPPDAADPSPTATAIRVATPSPPPSEPAATATSMPAPTHTPTSEPTVLPTQTPEPTRLPTLAPMATQGPTPTPLPPSPIAKLEHGAWLDANEPALAMDLRNLPWVADGVNETEREAAELLIEAARQHPEVFAALLTKPWVADDITAAETDAIYGLSRTPLFSEGFIEGMLEMSWAQDDITIDEGKTVGYLYRAIRWAPEISDELLAYPWLEPAVTPEVAAAVEYLYRAGRYVPDLAEILVGKPWVQDGITRQEASVIHNLYLIARAQDESLESETNAMAVELVNMPFLDSIEGADVPATGSLRRLEYDDTSRYLEVMSHPVLQDGITDEEAKIVALLWGVNRYKPEHTDDLLTQTGIFVEEKTIQLPFSGEVQLAVFRHRDHVTPSMDLLENSVTFIEEFMASPLPHNYMAVYFTDAIPEHVGGKHFLTYIAAQPRFDLAGTSAWKHTPFVIAHEIAHHYWRGNKWDWIDEGLAVFLATLSENSRTGFPVETRKRPCASPKTIRELEAKYTEETGTEGDRCNYPLGEAIFLDLYHSLGEETFARGLRRLYAKDLRDDPTDDCEGTELGICHLVAAFKDGASKNVASMVDEVVMRRYGPLP